MVKVVECEVEGLSKMERLRRAIRQHHGEILNHTELEKFIDQHYVIHAKSYGWRAAIKRRLMKEGYLIDLGYDERARGHPHYFMLADPNRLEEEREEYLAEIEAL